MIVKYTEKSRKFSKEKEYSKLNYKNNKKTSDNSNKIEYYRIDKTNNSI